MSSRRLLLTGAAGTLFALAGTRIAAADATGPLGPWRAAPAAAHPDPRVRALHWAVLAPNPHNRQPWLIELLGEDSLLLRCDLDRRLPATDPFDRQITLGLGGFAELFRMAAAAEGLTATVEPFPEGEPRPRLDPRPVARIRLTRGAAPDSLFAHATTRRSNKQPFDASRGVPADLLAALGAAAGPELRFGATVLPAEVDAVRALAWAAWETEATTPVAHRESVDLMRFGRAAVEAAPDGISLWGPGIEQAVAAGQLTPDSIAVPGRPGFAIMVDRYRALFAATPGFLWLAGPGGRAAELAAGRAWLRVNLAATGAGLAVHPVSQALQEYAEMAPHHAAAHARLGRPGEVVQMLARVGYAPPAAPTPRWPAETRILRG